MEDDKGRGSHAIHSVSQDLQQSETGYVRKQDPKNSSENLLWTRKQHLGSASGFAVYQKCLWTRQQRKGNDKTLKANEKRTEFLTIKTFFLGTVLSRVCDGYFTLIYDFQKIAISPQLSVIPVPYLLLRRFLAHLCRGSFVPWEFCGCASSFVAVGHHMFQTSHQMSSFCSTPDHASNDQFISIPRLNGLNSMIYISSMFQTKNERLLKNPKQRSIPI